VKVDAPSKRQRVARVRKLPPPLADRVQNPWLFVMGGKSGTNALSRVERLGPIHKVALDLLNHPPLAI